MFDTHCHLNYETFNDEKELNKIIVAAREVGLTHAVIPGMDLSTSFKARNIAEDYHQFYFAAGIHPTEKLDDLKLDEVQFKLEELLKDSLKAVAIGECGLDYYKPQSGHTLQIEFLKMHINLAKRTGLSLILHNRLATDDLLQTLEKSWTDNLSGHVVMHCASPEPEVLNYAFKKHIYLGFDGDITYDSAKQNFIKEVPNDLIVLETDTPFLTPEPVRSEKRFPNEPKNIVYTAQKIADLKGVELEKLIKITTNNAKRLFNI